MRSCRARSPNARSAPGPARETEPVAARRSASATRVVSGRCRAQTAGHVGRAGLHRCGPLRLRSPLARARGSGARRARRHRPDRPVHVGHRRLHLARVAPNERTRLAPPGSRSASIADRARIDRRGRPDRAARPEHDDRRAHVRRRPRGDDRPRAGSCTGAIPADRRPRRAPSTQVAARASSSTATARTSTSPTWHRRPAGVNPVVENQPRPSPRPERRHRAMNPRRRPRSVSPGCGRACAATRRSANTSVCASSLLRLISSPPITSAPVSPTAPVSLSRPCPG